MLPIALVNEIDFLVHAGTLSHRKIAQRLGVSRGVVDAIANGRRSLHGCDSVEEQPPVLPATRCPSCGYRVHLPCLVCRTREHHQRQVVARVLVRMKEMDRYARSRRRAG
jgi:hypothetical protein